MQDTQKQDSKTGEMAFYRLERLDKPEGGVIEPGLYAFADDAGVVLALDVGRPTRGRDLAAAMKTTHPVTRLGDWYRVETEGADDA